ncbi:MAG: hypothetical protein EOO73_07110 [Myxococcales bacterium]|nr:MAG: hypothetical protein EOO73_07110 [Myxococcales bacterium]
MSTPKRYAAFALCLCASWLVAAGCGSGSPMDTAGPQGSSGSSNGGAGGTSGGPTVFDPGGTSSGGGQGQLNSLCGPVTPSMCLPEDSSACATYEPPSGGAGGVGGEGGGGGASAGEGGALHVGGAPGSAGTPGGGADAAGAPANGGAPDGGGESSGGAGGQGGEGQEPPPLPAYGCQVSHQNNKTVRSCVRAGVGLANAPCFSAGDCAPGLACVTEGEAGRCLPYCCDFTTPCEAGSYCAPRPLRKGPAESSDAEPTPVPVCVPADGCSLEDRYPCASGTECRCQGGTACMVVRDDGTTTCLKPGSGQQGEECPCAWNHVCSKVTNRCIQICRTDATESECGEQKCQAASELPDKFGFCVGPVR